jgi:hypothetical protein
MWLHAVWYKSTKVPEESAASNHLRRKVINNSRSRIFWNVGRFTPNYESVNSLKLQLSFSLLPQFHVSQKHMQFKVKHNIAA